MLKSPLFYMNGLLVAIIGLMALGMNADNPNLPNSLRALAQTTNEIIRGNGVSTSMAQFTGIYTLGKSEIYQDSAKNIGIGTQTPVMKLDLNGALTTNNNPIYGYDVCGTGTGIMKCLNSLRWTDIAAIPAGFADGVDDVGAPGAAYTAGSNINPGLLAGGTVAVVKNPVINGTLTVNGDINMGYEIVKSSVGSGMGGVGLASCPVGKKVIGGGCYSAGLSGSIYRSYPSSDTTWRCEVSSGMPLTYAICARIGN